MKFCEQCGNKLEEGAGFCENCGAKVDSTADSQTSPEIDTLTAKANSGDVNAMCDLTEIYMRKKDYDLALFHILKAMETGNNRAVDLGIKLRIEMKKADSQSSAPPSQASTPKPQAVTTKGKLNIQNGVYEGDIVNGKATGKGKFTFNDGSGTYEGDFVDGKWHGKGKKTTTYDGNIYEGNFVNSDLRGNGKITFPNGDVFEGELEGEGKGTMTYANGKIKKGKYKYREFKPSLFG
jgi:hypothetical protein